MRISLAIPTIGRTSELQRLLESLCQQTYKDFEVLIADQNPPDLLQPLFQTYASQLPLQVFHVAPQGVSAARNALLSKLTGDIVAFPDDDCFYAPHTLERVCALFQKYPEHHGIIGKWYFPENNDVVDTVSANKIISRYNAFFRGETHVQFYRRQVIDTVGGFDPRLGPGTGLPFGCGEDTDYLLRVLESGFSAMRCPTVCSFHEAPNRVPLMSSKWHAYGIGRMALIKKHHMPLWFSLANVLYPLLCAPFEGPQAWSYRWHMFRGRLHGLLHTPKLY